jgi:hypothetical protein
VDEEVGVERRERLGREERGGRREEEEVGRGGVSRAWRCV